MAIPDTQIHHSYKPTWRTAHARWDCYLQADGTYKVRFIADWAPTTEWMAGGIVDLFELIKDEMRDWEDAMRQRFLVRTEKVVTYCHPGDTSVRFKQLRGDTIPQWAADVKEE